jgi:VWFA-related protein
VKLTVVVTEKSGKPVPNLEQQSFAVYDNGKPAKVVSFHAPRGAAAPEAAEPPVEIVLVLDEVNTGYEKVAYAQEGVKQFLLQNDGRLAHPVSLAFSADSGLQMQKAPSTDGKMLAEALQQRGHAQRTIGRGALGGDQERLQISLRAMESLMAEEARKPGRKLVIWVSPGWPLLSGPQMNLTTEQLQRVFNSIVLLSSGTRQTGMTLYSVDPLGGADAGGGRTTYYENFVKGVTKPANAELGDVGLQVLAEQTGGQVIFGNSAIAGSINKCVTDLDATYLLSIEAAPAEKANEFHSLAVKMATPGLKARTRNGYYAQP